MIGVCGDCESCGNYDAITFGICDGCQNESISEVEE